MYLETATAFRALIEATDFGSIDPKITFEADELVVPDESGDPTAEIDFTTPSVTIRQIDEDQDLARAKDGVIRLGYDSDTGEAHVIDYPEPWILTYQVEVRSSDQPRAVLEAIAMNEAVKRALGSMGGIDVVYTLGDYTLTAHTEYTRSEPPTTMNGTEGRGRFRTDYRYAVSAWLFPATSPRSVKTIKYRLFEFADPPDWADVYRTENPDNYGG